MRYRFAAAASADLEAIGDFIALDSPRRVESFIDEIEDRRRLLAEFPETGRPRPDLAPEIRAVPFGSYLNCYAIQPDILETRRVLHGARNIGPDDFFS